MTDRIPFPEHAWPLLRKALEHIAAHPDEFYMHDYVVDVAALNPVDPLDGYRISRITMRTGLPLPKCGTVACLAGHIVLRNGDGTVDVDSDGAMQALGITPHTAVAYALDDVFEMIHIRTYAELAAALEARFTFPEPLPAIPAAVSP